MSIHSEGDKLEVYTAWVPGADGKGNCEKAFCASDLEHGAHTSRPDTPDASELYHLNSESCKGKVQTDPLYLVRKCVRSGQNALPFLCKSLSFLTRPFWR
eukprot:2792136-Rhodomonas_salina.1